MGPENVTQHQKHINAEQWIASSFVLPGPSPDTVRHLRQYQPPSWKSPSTPSLYTVLQQRGPVHQTSYLPTFR